MPMKKKTSQLEGLLLSLLTYTLSSEYTLKGCATFKCNKYYLLFNYEQLNPLYTLTQIVLIAKNLEMSSFANAVLE